MHLQPGPEPEMEVWGRLAAKRTQQKPSPEDGGRLVRHSLGPGAGPGTAGNNSRETGQRDHSPRAASPTGAPRSRARSPHTFHKLRWRLTLPPPAAGQQQSSEPQRATALCREHWRSANPQAQAAHSPPAPALTHSQQRCLIKKHTFYCFQPTWFHCIGGGKALCPHTLETHCL